MRQLVHQREQMLLGTQVEPQGDVVVGKAAVHQLGQGTARERRAAALRIRFQGLNVLENRGHGPTRVAHFPRIMRWSEGGRRPVSMARPGGAWDCPYAMPTLLRRII